MLSQCMHTRHKQTAFVALARVKWSSKASAFDSSLWTEARMLSDNKPRLLYAYIQVNQQVAGE